MGSLWGSNWGVYCRVLIDRLDIDLEYKTVNCIICKPYPRPQLHSAGRPSRRRRRHPSRAARLQHLGVPRVPPVPADVGGAKHRAHQSLLCGLAHTAMGPCSKIAPSVGVGVGDGAGAGAAAHQGLRF